MSYKITIVDNENGNVLLNEENAKAIIGAVTNDEHTACLGFTACKANDFLNALFGVDAAKDALLKNNPKIEARYALKGLMDICESNSAPTNSNS